LSYNKSSNNDDDNSNIIFGWLFYVAPKI